MKFIDLTHPFTKDTPVYPGDPNPTLEQVAFIQKNTYNDHRLTTLMHVGTHIDAPLHMIDGGKLIDEMPVEQFFGKGMLIDVRDKTTIDASVLEDTNIDSNSIVLLHTGWSKKYRTNAYYKDFPQITEEFAEKLVDHKVKMLGLDMPGPDPDQPWTIHKILLGNDILILENLTNLDKLLDVKDFEITALPMNLHSDAAPVRVIAKIPS